MENNNFKRATIVAIIGAFSVGLVFILLGSISVELMIELGIDAAQFGTLVMTLFLTMVIVQLFIGPLVDKVGYKPVAIGGFLVTPVGILILSFASSFTLAFFSCILLGIGAISISTVANTLMPVVLFKGKDPARASNFGNAFFALGYVLTPWFVAFIINSLNLQYNSALLIISILMFITLLFIFITNFPKVSIGFKFDMALKLLLKPAVLIAAFALFCYISLEVTLGTWIRMLMEELYGESTTLGTTARTSLVLGMFGVAMMVGRFISSTVKNLTAMGSKLIILASVISLLSILLMVFAWSPAVGIVAIIIAGLVFGPIFPTIVGVTFSKFDPSLYGSIFGIIFSIGLLGGTFIPMIIGNLIVGYTVQQSLLIAAIMAVMLIIISLFIARTGNDKTVN